MRTLQTLQDEVKSCTKCSLHTTRTQTVFSRGNANALLCFIGEAPGEDEDLQGLPFVGRSGQLLNKAVTELGLDPNNDIYVCNIVKCRPPGNRKPSDDEVTECIGYLDEQLKLIHAKVIIALGNTSISNLINTTFGISKIRGKFFKRQGMMVMPTYHPSYILRGGGKGQLYDEFKQDIQLAIDKSKE